MPTALALALAVAVNWHGTGSEQACASAGGPSSTLVQLGSIWLEFSERCRAPIAARLGEKSKDSKSWRTLGTSVRQS